MKRLAITALLLIAGCAQNQSVTTPPAALPRVASAPQPAPTRQVIIVNDTGPTRVIGEPAKPSPFDPASARIKAVPTYTPTPWPRQKIKLRTLPMTFAELDPKFIATPAPAESPAGRGGIANPSIADVANAISASADSDELLGIASACDAIASAMGERRENAFLTNDVATLDVSYSEKMMAWGQLAKAARLKASSGGKDMRMVNMTVGIMLGRAKRLGFTSSRRRPLTSIPVGRAPNPMFKPGTINP